MLNGLEGTNIHGQTVRIIGLGHIGLSVAKIFKGFGAHLPGTDVFASAEFNQYEQQVDLDTALAKAGIISYIVL